MTARLYTCRSCGAQAEVWGGSNPCPHCGAPHINRLEPERVKAELSALAFLHGKTHILNYDTREQDHIETEKDVRKKDERQGDLFSR